MSDKGTALGTEEALEAERLWARREAKKAVRIFRLRPIKNLASLKQGDVLVSRTTTLRLVLDVERSSEGRVLKLLKYTDERDVGIETTVAEHLDASRFRAALNRRLENPLGNMGEIPKNLEREIEIFENVKTLLGSGEIGHQFFDAIRVKREEDEKFTTLKLFVGGRNGDILGLEPRRVFSTSTEVDFLVNAADLPSDEFIKRVAFERDASPMVRRNVLFASMLANTLKNVRNLVELAGRAGMGI